MPHPTSTVSLPPVAPPACDVASGPDLRLGNIQRLALIGKYRAAQTHNHLHICESVRQICQFLQRQGVAVVLETHTFAALQQTLGAACVTLAQLPHFDMERLGAHCDAAVVVGGDGTMLSTARTLAPQNVPLIGINQGRLGFITDISLSDYARQLPQMLQGQYRQDWRSMLKARVWRAGLCAFEALVLNDVVLHRGSSKGMVEVRIDVDDVYLATQRADGLILATPTGATAYAMAAGGPLMAPDIPGWVLVPIAPHALSNRPIVLTDSALTPTVVRLQVVGERSATAHFDAQVFTSLRPGDHLTVHRAAERACFLHPIDWNYFATLRAKLHWNEGGS